MKKKYYFIIGLVIIFICCCFIMFYKNKNDLVQVGTSKFYIEIPSGYKDTIDDFSENQISYYFKDDDSIDFDIYQWVKEDNYNLQDEANHYASVFNTNAIEVSINGNYGMKYISSEIYNNYEYTVINYMFDDGEYIILFSFWTINTDKEIRDVDNIINTLKKDEK